MEVDEENDSNDSLNDTLDENDDDANRVTNVPIDSGWAWAIVFGAFGICALVGGVLKSFGVLLLELSRRYDAPTSLLTSSQSVCGCLHLALGPVANALSMRFSHRRVIFVGGLVAGVGLILTAVIQDVGPFFVTYGIITGLGFGFCISPSLVIPGFYFKKRLAIANGFSAAGIGAGAFIFPNLMRFLLDEYSIQGCLLVIGGLMFNICVFASLLRPVSFWLTKNNKGMPNVEVPQNSTSQSERRAPDGKYIYTNIKMESKLSSSCENDFKLDVLRNNYSASVPCIQREFDYHQRRDDTALSSTGNRQLRTDYLSHPALIYASIDSLPFVVNSTHIPYPHKDVKTKVSKEGNGKRIIEWKILKNTTFHVLNLGIFFGIFAHHTVYNFIPPLANELGMTDTQGALSVSIVGLTDLIGRMSAGLLSDTLCKQRRTTFQTSMFIFGCCIALLAHMDTLTGFLITCGFLGFFTGGYVGIQIAVLVELLGVDNLSSSWGFVAFFSSLSILINPATSGLIKDYTGSWIPAFWLGSASAIAGSLILCVHTMLHRRIRKRGH